MTIRISNYRLLNAIKRLPDPGRYKGKVYSVPVELDSGWLKSVDFTAPIDNSVSVYRLSFISDGKSWWIEIP